MKNTFKERIDEAMRIAGVESYAELARKAGVSKPNLSQWVNGVYEPKPAGIAKLSDALNINPAWLMGHDAPMYYDLKELTAESDRYESFSKNDKKDVATSLNFLIEQLNQQEMALMFDGEPLDDETKELLKESLENSLKMGKMIAKKKYTPNKYRK